MTCEMFNAKIDAFIDNELAEEEMIEMLEHCEQCPECAEELAAAEQMRDLLLPEDASETLPLSVRASWRKAVVAESKKQEQKKPKRNVLRFVSGLAAAAVVAFGAQAMLKPKTEVADIATAPATIVQSDSVEVKAIEDGSIAASEATRITVKVDDLEAAKAGFADIAEEYGLEVLNEEVEDDRVELTLSVKDVVDAEDAIAAMESFGTVEGEPFAINAANFSIVLEGK